MRVKRIAFLVALIFLALAPARAAEQSPTERILDGHKIINVVDDFLAFWDQAEGKPLRIQRRLWHTMVESRHQNYFDRAVYREATREDRRALLDQFLQAVPDRIEAIRQLNASLLYIGTNPIISAIVAFRVPLDFRNYKQQNDIYFGLSLMTFDGSVRAVGNDVGLPDTLCIGADVLATYKPEQARIAIIHEFFHLYHFNFLLKHPDLYKIRGATARLMIEGMAIAASKMVYEMVYTGQPLELYLNFSEEELAAQQNELAQSSRRYLQLIRSNAPPEEYGIWFANLASDEAPPRGGYLLGYQVVKRVLPYHFYSLEQMARMSPAELRHLAEEQLASMSGEQVLLMAGDRD